MMKRTKKSITILLFVILYSNSNIRLFAQSVGKIDSVIIHENILVDNVQKNRPLKIILPVTFMTYGAIAKFDRSSKSADNEIREAVYKNIGRRFTVDDYAQYAPGLSVFALDFLGVKAKHNLADRGITMVASMALMGTIVHASKKITKIQRPDGTGFNSFPSGHTATAFVGAHILFKEYKNVSPWIGVAGYTIAAGTGAFRVINNKHWMSDVLAGAGVAILTVEITYLLLPEIKKVFQTGNRDRLKIQPFTGYGATGLSLNYTF